MMERNKLGLREITQEGYLKLMNMIGKPRFRVYPDSDGFARIINPLVYPNYQVLLKLFRATPDSRRASVQREPGDWLRVERDKIEHRLNDLIIEAYKIGFLYLSFSTESETSNELETRDRETNEIGFELFIFFNLMELPVVSTSLEIPGDEWDHYTWNKPPKQYKKIRGIYVPSYTRP